MGGIDGRRAALRVGMPLRPAGKPSFKAVVGKEVVHRQEGARLRGDLVVFIHLPGLGAGRLIRDRRRPGVVDGAGGPPKVVEIIGHRAAPVPDGGGVHPVGKGNGVAGLPRPRGVRPGKLGHLHHPAFGGNVPRCPVVVLHPRAVPQGQPLQVGFPLVRHLNRLSVRTGDFGQIAARIRHGIPLAVGIHNRCDRRGAAAFQLYPFSRAVGDRG